MQYRLDVNGVSHRVHADPEMPLLWVLRDYLGYNGTKFGCGAGLCGACTVHLDGKAARSCITPVGSVGQAKIKTIEALSADNSHPVQKAWIAEQVPQCGYCQSGMIMAVAALLQDKPRPTRADITEVITNVCRCGTYPRIAHAIEHAIEHAVEQAIERPAQKT